MQLYPARPNNDPLTENLQELNGRKRIHKSLIVHVCLWKTIHLGRRRRPCAISTPAQTLTNFKRIGHDNILLLQQSLFGQREREREREKDREKERKREQANIYRKGHILECDSQKTVSGSGLREGEWF
jgi:hypothetical protein